MDNGEDIIIDEINCELTLPIILVSPPSYPGLINIGALSLSFKDLVLTPKGSKAFISSPIGRVFKESSPVNITSLSLKAETDVINRNVVPEFAKSIGFSE